MLLAFNGLSMFWYWVLIPTLMCRCGPAIVTQYQFARFEGKVAKLSELIPCVAKVTGVTEASVAVHARHLRAERLISTSGRGPGGAEMTAEDAAALLVSIIGADQAKNGPAIVEASKRSKCIRKMSIDGNIVGEFGGNIDPNGMCFFDDVVFVINIGIGENISCEGDCKFMWAVTIMAELPSLFFSIDIKTNYPGVASGKRMYTAPKVDRKELDLSNKLAHGDFRISRGVGAKTIDSIASILKGRS